LQLEDFPLRVKNPKQVETLGANQRVSTYYFSPVQEAYSFIV
jgi:hypothetical protein